MLATKSGKYIKEEDNGMLDYKEIIIKHYVLHMSGAKIA
jgi:hypothetical protein